MEGSPYHPTGSEPSHTPVHQLLSLNIVYPFGLPYSLVLRGNFLSQSPEAGLVYSAMYPTYDRTCFISSSAVIWNSSSLSIIVFSRCLHYTVHLNKPIERSSSRAVYSSSESKINISILYKHESSVPHLQEPSTCSYHYSPCLSIKHFEDIF